MEEYYYMGVDPSTVSTGYSVFHSNGDLVDWGVIRPNKKKLTEPQQAAFQYNALNEIMKKYNIVGVGCEDQHRGPNVDTLKKLCRVTGYVILLAGLYDVPLKLYHPSSWRKVANGKGNATKQETIDWANETYNLLLRVKDNDIADGIGIGYAAMVDLLGDKQAEKEKANKALS